jgi:hypothetical protein
MNKLAIVGTGPLTRDQAPFEDKTFDIWVFNEAPMDDWCKRWDAVFQMHTPEVYTGHNVKHPGYWEWLKQDHGKPIFMQHVDHRVPFSVCYPIESAMMLGGHKYFGMSMCYAVALALLQGYEHIEIWGVELSFTEYQYGADSWRYWIGLATGKLGTDHVVLHCGENLFASPSYGYEGGLHFGKEYFQSRVDYLNSSWVEYDHNLAVIKSKIINLVKTNRYELVADAITELEGMAQKCGEYAGALAEAEKYSGFSERVSERNDFEYAAAKASTDGEEKRALMYHTGGMVEYVWTLWKQTHDDKAKSQLLDLIGKLGELAYDTGAYHGIYTENIGYILKFDGMVQANGRYVAQAPITMPEMAAL